MKKYISLSAFDDQWYILDDRTNTLPYGRKDVKIE